MLSHGNVFYILTGLCLAWMHDMFSWPECEESQDQGFNARTVCVDKKEAGETWTTWYEVRLYLGSWMDNNESKEWRGLICIHIRLTASVRSKGKLFWWSVSTLSVFILCLKSIIFRHIFSWFYCDMYSTFDIFIFQNQLHSVTLQSERRWTNQVLRFLQVSFVVLNVLWKR